MKRRQAEVINFAAYYSLRATTMYRPAHALAIVRRDPQFVAEAEERFAAVVSKRRDAAEPAGRKCRAQIIPFRKAS